MEPAGKIIASIEKAYPKSEPSVIANCSDYNISGHAKQFPQFILGVTEQDRFGGGIRHYENWINRELDGQFGKIKCLAWAFEEHEIEEAKSVVGELAAYYNVKIDVEDMFNKAHIKNGRDIHYYYVVVSIVPVNILHVA